MNKHTTKRTVSLIAAAMMAMGGLVGCQPPKKETGLEDFENRPKKVNVIYTANAFGKEWITNVAREYMTYHNEDTYIHLEQTVTAGEEYSKVETGTASGDLYLFDQSLQTLNGQVEDMADVWNSYAIGEEDKAGAKLIKDKLTPLMQSVPDPYGIRAYSLPYSHGTTYGFVYNKTVLDAAFPNGYTLPRTTEELFEMGDALKSVDLADVNSDQDVYLLSASLGDNNENLKYSQWAWFYQLMGYEKAEQFFSNGRYWDEASSKYLFDESKPTVYEVYKDEVMEFYNILDELMTESNKYVHKDANSMDYIYASGAAAGAGFKANKSKVAFKVDGIYFESESNMFLKSLESRGQKQEMGMMHFPVASAIINRLSTVNDDAMLREVISYVDGDTTTKPAGVSDADIEAVAEARGITPMYLGGGMVIPKTASNKAGAKDFIRFMCSDEAAIASAKGLAGLEIIPYGKMVSNEELGFEKSHFLTTVSKWQTENKLLAANSGLFETYGRFGVADGTADNTLCYTIFRGQGAGAEAFWQTAYTAFAYDWNIRVQDFKRYGGVTTND